MLVVQGRAAVGAAIVDADVVFGALRLEMSGKDVVGKPRHGASNITSPFINPGSPSHSDAAASSHMLRQPSKLTKQGSAASRISAAPRSAVGGHASPTRVGAHGTATPPVLAPAPPHSKVCIPCSSFHYRYWNTGTFSFLLCTAALDGAVVTITLVYCCFLSDRAWCYMLSYIHCASRSFVVNLVMP